MMTQIIGIVLLTALHVIQFPQFALTQVENFDEEEVYELSACPEYHTINITDGEFLPNGSYLHDGKVFPPGHYGHVDGIWDANFTKSGTDSHLRGCICTHSGVECVRVCCNENSNGTIDEFCPEMFENRTYHMITENELNISENHLLVYHDITDGCITVLFDSYDVKIICARLPIKTLLDSFDHSFVVNYERQQSHKFQSELFAGLKMRQKPKNFQFLLIFCAFSHCLATDISLVRTHPEDLSCNFERTINITDGKLLIDNSWEHDGLKYGLGFYAKFNYILNGSEKTYVPEHVRGCICLLKPCIMACCPDRQMVRNNNSNDCVSERFDTMWWDVGIEGEESVKTDVAKAFHWSFNPITNCEKTYLEPDKYEFDIWYLGQNGSIYLPDEKAFLTYDEHCVSVDQQSQKLLVLRCYDPHQQDSRYSMLGIGMSLSVPFLIATFIVYAVIPELRNVHGMSLMSYVGSLAVGYTVLGTVQIWGSRKECHDGTVQCFNPYYCTTAAYIIYFSFIVSFFWLNTMCFDIYWTFRGVRGSTSAKKNFIYYCIYAWGMGLFFTLFSLSMDISGIPETFKPGMYFTQTCFLKHEHISEFIYLYSILLILICMNITFFGVTAYRIKKVQSETAAVVDADSSRRHSRHQYDNYRFMLYLRLFVIMGVTWSWEVISWSVSPDSQWFYVTDLINCSQGILIFLLVVCNDKVRKLVIKRYYKFRGIAQPETTFSDTRSSRISNYNRHNSIQMEQRNTLLGANNKDKEIKDMHSNNNYINNEKKHSH